MPLLQNCAICGALFKTKPYFLKHGGGKYCSSKCHHEGLRKGKMVPCTLCGKETYKKLLQLSRSASKTYFCSKSCQTRWRNEQFSGPRHANWKQGEHSYRGVLERSNLPKYCCLCKGTDARVLAVHHIDRDHKNNSIENLAWLCHNCHFLVHHHKAGQEMGLLK